MKNDDLFQSITDKIIANLDGAKKWSKPWGNIADRTSNQNGKTGHPYSGINWLLTGNQGYTETQWLTFNQIKEIGGSIAGKKGVGCPLIFYGTGKKKDPKEGEATGYRFLKTYTVWNVEEIDDLDRSKLKALTTPVPADTAVTDLAIDMGVQIDYGGNKACFTPSTDRIRMPYLEAFKDKHNFDSTLLHELIHWTGHSSRLKRTTGGKFGSSDYAFEELVAELGAAMAGSLMGLPYDGLQHDSYIKSWVSRLEGDCKYIYEASKQASKAVTYLMEYSAEAKSAA